MDTRPHPKRTAIERFMALTLVIPGGCWEWRGTKNKLGYGQFRVDGARKNGRKIAPYRFIWEYIHGPMPAELEPDHTCNNRNCVNPEHIEAVTHSENQRRSYQRGRKRPGRDYVATKRPTHCPKGHEYTPENTHISKQNSIQCKACNRVRCAAYQARRRLIS